MIKISTHAGQALGDEQLQRNLRSTLSKTLHSREKAVREVPEWEQLREYARAVKAHTLSRLDSYLEALESRLQEQGAHVFWARDSREALEFILDLARNREVESVVKSKTMVGEEIGLNAELERYQIDVVESDLGEFIVQLAHQPPSHIIAPALHLSRDEIANLFVQEVGMEPTRDVREITLTARKLLRSRFLKAGMGITGANFAIAETGTVVIVENEGNAHLSCSAPSLHVAVMGIEKVLPRISDLPAFLKLLTRSATGQKITSYVNLINGPRRRGESDGPGEFHLVLLDNGRSKILSDDFLRQTLSCIRCGACLNVCPVYQSIGGHAYASTYQGPIGSILTPQLEGLSQAPEHPFASSLCGACFEACPVKIEIPSILLELRSRVQAQKASDSFRLPLEPFVMGIWAWAMRRPENYRRFSKLIRLAQAPFKRSEILKIPFPPFKQWSRSRTLPALAGKSFRELIDEEITS